MPQNLPSPSQDGARGWKLYEFVDEDHPVTDEDRNRPQYGRPQRKPTSQAEAPKADGDAPPDATAS